MPQKAEICGGCRISGLTGERQRNEPESELTTKFLISDLFLL